MSLGVFWSLLNPLVMMVVLTFVFTQVFTTAEPNFPLFLFCGLLPYNFFAIAWTSATASLVDNAALVKRVPVPREVIPIATVLSCALHLLIQMALLLLLVVAFGKGVNVHWLWLPVVLGLEVVFVLGLSLLTAGLNVFTRDTRYVVESITTVMFWLVPIFYSISLVPQQYWSLYHLNPLAALTVALRNILLQDASPAWSLLGKMAMVSALALAAGGLLFHKLKSRFYNYL